MAWNAPNQLRHEGSIYEPSIRDKVLDH